ncbi:MAG: hypothetical protein KDA22_13100 [Phycisphaerales bacterium]|nr:hypothetical protein [Phycisphaerales bacterium]
MRPLLVAILAATSLAILVAFAAGQVLSDRFAFSQWLLWIPAPVAMVAAIALLASGMAARGRWRILLCVASIAGVVGSIAVALRDHHPFRAAPDLDGRTDVLRITHWNPQWIAAPEARAIKPVVENLHHDLTIVTNAGALRLREIAESWEQEGNEVLYLSPFAVLSRLPVLEARKIVAADGTSVAYLRIDATARLGREITVFAIDLPSRPSIPRMELAERIHGWIEESDVGPPDLVVGDFNITRGSAAMSALFPGLHDAYDEAGRGLGTSYPRNLPLWSIDHILLGPGLRALDYALVDPGSHGHRAQTAVIEAASPPPT